MKIYTKHQLFDKLKTFDKDTLVYLHVFPFFESEPSSFYTYLCILPSAIGLINLLPPETRYTYKIK